ncbi:unnamed protein product [Sphagnum tenellum]
MTIYYADYFLYRLDEDDGYTEEQELELSVTYTYDKGYAQTGPSYACGGEPGEPPSVEIHTIEVTNTKLPITLTDEELEEIQEWLIGNHEEY